MMLSVQNPSTHLQPQRHVDDGVGRADGVAEVPPAPGGGDERRGQDEQRAHRVHDAQVLDEQEVDAAQLEVGRADVVHHQSVGGQRGQDNEQNEQALQGAV